MKVRTILVSAAGAMLLVSPLAAQAATSKPAATNVCKGLKGQALKDCKAKQNSGTKPK